MGAGHGVIARNRGYDVVMHGSPAKRTLALDGTSYDFAPVALRFAGDTYEDAFATKNNKTLEQTIAHHRYAALASEVTAHYAGDLGVPLGTFILGLKKAGDPFYRKFLNKYGDLTYSTFLIADKDYLNAKGIYAYYLGDALKYIGRCKDSMKKRLNQGYGKIHAKNCYRDGQATNCHLNARITAAGPGVTLWLHAMHDDDEIEDVERSLIRAHEPPWNIQRG